MARDLRAVRPKAAGLLPAPRHGRPSPITRIGAATALLVLTGVPLLAGCKSLPPASPSTQAGIENDIVASRPANNVGFAPPIMITSPTR